MSTFTNETISASQFLQDLQDQYSSYSSSLKTQQLSPHARRAQRSRLNQFIGFLSHSRRNYESEKRASQPKDAAVSAYLDYLQYFLKARPSTVSKALSTINEFYEYIGVEPISIEREDLPGLHPQALSAEHVQKFLSAAAANPSIKHKALALLLGTTGVRAIDCTMLDIDDYVANTGILSIRGTDTFAPRTINLDAATKTALDQWLNLRHQRFNRTNEKALFLNPQRRRMSQAGVNLVVRKISLEAGLDLSAQQLRDTYLLKNSPSDSRKADAEHLSLHSNRAAI